MCIVQWVTERQPSTGVTLCYKWDQAAEMHAAYTAWRAVMVTQMLVCAFCGRAAFGGTPYAKDRFQQIPCPDVHPPYAATNMRLASHYGTRYSIPQDHCYGCVCSLQILIRALMLARNGEQWTSWNCCHAMVSRQRYSPIPEQLQRAVKFWSKSQVIALGQHPHKSCDRSGPRQHWRMTREGWKYSC